MIRKFFFLLIFLSGISLLAFQHVTPVAAATFTVTTNADSGAGSLRQAILDAANAAGADTIVFDNALSGGTITLTTGELVIGSDLSIDASALASPVTISGNDAQRVFEISYGFTVSMTNLIITKGNSMEGSGIRNNGNLTITRCRITSNVTTGVGGGIVNSMVATGMTIIQSEISNNVGTGGAGIFNAGKGMLIESSTISGNTTNGASSGGGLYLQQTTTIRNSTISGNDSGSASAILFLNSGQVLTLENCTITGNTNRNATVAGYAIEFGLNPVFNYSNTIIANNTYKDSTNQTIEGHDCSSIGATIGTNLNNLVEDGTCSAALSGDPKLAPLADNGGFTKTHALLTGSIALRAANATTFLSTDQRGVTRPQPAGTVSDIGAFESRISTMTAVKSYPELSATDTKPTVTLKLTRSLNGVIDTTFAPMDVLLDGTVDAPCPSLEGCETAAWTATWTVPYDPAYNYMVAEPIFPTGFAPSITQTSNTDPLRWTVENHKLPKLTLQKIFVTAGSGTPSLWTLSATKTGETTAALEGTADQVVSGFLTTGSYTLAEAGTETGFTPGTTWNCGTGNEAVTTITLAFADDVTCTITNTAIEPKLKLAMAFDPATSGTLDNWTLKATGSGATPTNLSGISGSDAVDSALAYPLAMDFLIGTYALSVEGTEPGFVPAASWNCGTGLEAVNEVTLAYGSDITCTMLNKYTAPTLPDTGFPSTAQP